MSPHLVLLLCAFCTVASGQIDQNDRRKKHCPPGKLTRFLRFENRAPAEDGLTVTTSGTERLCARACVMILGHDCVWYHWHEGNNQCYYSANILTAETIAKKDSTTPQKFGVKVCLDATVQSASTSFIWGGAAHYILVGHTQKVHKAEDLSDCMNYCLHQVEDCRSGMFFPQEEENCVLNSETRATAEDSFAEVLDPKLLVYYFDVGY